MSDEQTQEAEAPVEAELSAEDEQKLAMAFKYIDKNSNDSIDASEFEVAWRGMGENPTDEEIQNALKMMDKNSDDSISYSEFRQFFLDNLNARKTEEVRRQELQEAFAHFDKKKDGYVSKAELKAILCHGDKRLSEEDVNYWLEQWEENNEGKLSTEEIMNFLLTDEA